MIDSSWNQETNLSSTLKPFTPVTHIKDAQSLFSSSGSGEGNNKKCISTSEKSIQAEIMSITEEITDSYGYQKPRSIEECKKVLQSEVYSAFFHRQKVNISTTSQRWKYISMVEINNFVVMFLSI